MKPSQKMAEAAAKAANMLSSNNQPSLLEWPLFLMLKGDQFKKDSFSVKNM